MFSKLIHMLQRNGELDRSDDAQGLCKTVRSSASSSKRQRGVFLVEFTFVIPIIILLTLGGFEMARYIRVHQLTNKLSYEMANALLRSCVNTYPTVANAEYISLQSTRTERCYSVVFTRYKTLLGEALPGATSARDFSINSIIVNRNEGRDFCRGYAFRGKPSDQTQNEITNPKNNVTQKTAVGKLPDDADCIMNFKAGGEKDYIPKLTTRPATLTFTDVLGHAASHDDDNVAIWTEFSVKYTPIVQKLLLPFTGFRMEQDQNDGKGFQPFNHVTATSSIF